MTSAKRPEVRLQHILEHIDGILSATAGLSPQEIGTSYVLVRAIERAIQIISEAAKELPPEVRAEEPDVPWKPIINIGNLLRHEYYRIREGDLHDILRNHLPRLRAAAARLLASHTHRS